MDQVPEVPGFWYTRTDADADRYAPGSLEERIIALARRSADRAEGLERLLGRSELAVGAHAFCELTGTGNQCATVFSQCWLGGHEHYVHTRGLTELRRRADDIREVTIVTGLCLFSNRAVWLETTEGQRLSVIDAQQARFDGGLRRIVEDPRPTMYELESSTRLARFIADLVVALPPECQVTVRIDVPRVQYHCYLLDLMDVGLIDAGLLSRWFELVDRRWERVSILYRNALRHWLEAAGGADSVALVETEGLDPIAETISSTLGAGRVPNAPELARELCRRDPVWRRVCEVAPPSAYSDLGYLSYTVEQLRAGLAARPGDGGIVLAVDNRQERRIFERALRLAKALQSPSVRSSLVGLYPLERALVAGRWSGLFYNDPGQRLIDQQGRSYVPSQLTEALYGGDDHHGRLSDTLQWLTQAA